MKAYLENKMCKIKENTLKSQLIKKKFGEKKDGFLYIDFFESYYLFERKKIKIYKEEKELSLLEFKKIVKRNIKNFENKYLVYKDFKNKGYLLKDGGIFGFDFRVYKENTKKHEHTLFVLDVLETHKDTMSRIIKSERLANSINAGYFVAIVDLDEKVLKLKIERNLNL